MNQTWGKHRVQGSCGDLSRGARPGNVEPLQASCKSRVSTKPKAAGYAMAMCGLHFTSSASPQPLVLFYSFKQAKHLSWTWTPKPGYI